MGNFHFHGPYFLSTCIYLTGVCCFLYATMILCIRSICTTLSSDSMILKKKLRRKITIDVYIENVLNFLKIN